MLTISVCLRTDRAADLGHVAEAVEYGRKAFRCEIAVIGFCGAAFYPRQLHDRRRKFAAITLKPSSLMYFGPEGLG